MTIELKVASAQALHTTSRKFIFELRKDLTYYFPQLAEQIDTY